MIRIFPKCRAVMLAGSSVAFVIAAAIVHERQPWYWAAAVLVLGLLLSFLAASFMAESMHRHILLYLYELIQPAGFIEGYTALLSQAQVRPGPRFSMLIHLSNAYAAAGDHGKALEILQETPALSGRAASEAAALLAGSRCGILCAMGDAAGAEKQLQLLRSVPPIGRHRASDLPAVLQAKLAVLEDRTTEADADLIREILKKPATALYKADLQFWLGRIYADLGQPELSAHYFSQVAAYSPRLAAAVTADQYLKDAETHP